MNTIDAWKTECLNLLRLAAANPEHTVEWIMALVLGLALSVLALQKAGKAFRCSMSTNGRCSVVVLSSAVLLLIGVAAANLYVVPHIGHDLTAQLIPVIVAVILVLAAFVPLAMLLLKGGYGPVLVSLLISIATAIAVGFLVRGAGSAIRHGIAGFDNTRNRTKSINEVL